MMFSILAVKKMKLDFSLFELETFIISEYNFHIWKNAVLWWKATAIWHLNAWCVDFCFISSALPEHVRKRKMVEYNSIQALFWRLNTRVRRLVWCTLLPGQRDPCGLSHSHSCSGTKGPGSGLIGWHLLHVFSCPRVVHMKDRTSAGGSPRYHHLKVYGAGAMQGWGVGEWGGAQHLADASARRLLCFADSAEAKCVFRSEIMCNSGEVTVGRSNKLYIYGT